MTNDYKHFLNFEKKYLNDSNKKASTIKNVSFSNSTSGIPLFFNAKALHNTNEFVFIVFNKKFYLDDLIIICLLLFLYTEDVDDIFLYIVLFLLLIT